MQILNIAITLFIIMEAINVTILYFIPSTKVGNGVGVFNSLQELEQQDQSPHHYDFAKYLINWVAGCKLIFLVLLIVVLFTGSELTKMWTVVAMILSIASYYWRLHPIITKLDRDGHITPKGYSKALFGMITGFMIMFATALIVYLIF